MKEGTNRDKRNSIVIALLLLMIIVLLGACWYGYSKYTTTNTGNSTTAVAKWDFGTNTVINGINLASASGASIMDTVRNVATNKIAPGTSGKFTVRLGTAQSDVAIKYTITLSNFAHKPANLHFYSDENHNNSIENNGTASITGYIAQGDTSSDHNVTVYWAWPYETGTGAAIATNDAQDTADGVAAQNMTFDITVNGTQVNPGSAQVTTSPGAVVTP